MIINDSTIDKSINAKLSAEEIEKIKVYLQGAVYCWCKNCKDENGVPKWFNTRDLFGGENFYWGNTPLGVLFQWHHKKRAEDAIEMAGHDAGNLLKEVLKKDRRNFNTREAYIREYQWDGQPD